MSAIWPLPPGTQMTSSCGHSAKLVVGTIFQPLAVATGSVVFHTRCSAVSGTSPKTSAGPVRSSCVTSGKRRRPICKGWVMGALLGLGADDGHRRAETGAEVARRDLQMALEGNAHRLGRAEAAPCRDFACRRVATGQEPTRLIEPETLHVLPRRHAHRRTEAAGE